MDSGRINQDYISNANENVNEFPHPPPLSSPLLLPRGDVRKCCPWGDRGEEEKEEEEEGGGGRRRGEFAVNVKKEEWKGEARGRMKGGKKRRVKKEMPDFWPR